MGERPYVVFGYGSLIWKVGAAVLPLAMDVSICWLTGADAAQPPPHVVAQSMYTDAIERRGADG